MSAFVPDKALADRAASKPTKGLLEALLGADDIVGQAAGFAGPLSPLAIPIGMAASKLSKASEPAIFVLKNLLKQGPDVAPDPTKIFLSERVRGTPWVPEVPPIKLPPGVELPSSAGLQSRSPALQKLRADQQHWKATSGNPSPKMRPPQADRRSMATTMQPNYRFALGHKKARLTEPQVREIQRLMAKGSLTAKVVGEKFGVSGSTVNEIKNGLAYRWVK